MNYSFLSGKTILITGGTGSFGTSFIEFMMNLNLSCSLVVYSRDWHKQKSIQAKYPTVDCVLGDVRDSERLKHVMAEFNVDIVIHAAAIKDVEFCEDNPTECLKTNVLGTQNVIDAVNYWNVDKCILISTDKAVLPCNTYGTSKKMAEKLWITANDNGDSYTRFSICRYGNVIGSSGSVLPLYKRLIADGVSELPITDIRMTRFWYKMDDAIKFVLDSLQNMSGKETFIPIIPSITILDLVKAFNMPYKVIGIRPGERLHEYMIPPDDVTGNAGYSSGNNEHFLTVDEIRGLL